MGSYTTNFFWDKPKPVSNQFDYSGGMINTPDTPETLNFPANPQLNKMSMFPDIQPGTFGNMWSGVKNFFGGNQGEGLTGTNVGTTYDQKMKDAWQGWNTMDTPGGTISVNEETGEVVPNYDIGQQPPDNIVAKENISSLDFAPPYTGGRKHGPNDPMGGGLFNLLMSSISPRWSGEGKYSEKFPARTFTEGDRTLTQKGLGGHYSPYEKDIMESFGQVGEYGDPRKDIFNQNIVSFADDHEEKLREWVQKYGTRQSQDKKFLLRQQQKNAMLQQINERKAADARQAALANRRAVEQYTGQPMSQYRRDRPASERRFTGHGRSGMGRDPSDRMAYGGRVGYKTGGRVGILAAF